MIYIMFVRGCARYPDLREVARSLCIRQGYTFIDNANINSSALNSSKLRLNPKGTAYLAVNFINFLRNKVYSKRRSKQLSNQDFQNAQLLQLGNYLTTLAMTNPTQSMQTRR